jgi:MoxR-like ATPase
MNFRNDAEAVDGFADANKKIKSEIGKIIFGQQQVIEQVLISIFCEGHSLLVGVPGLAKTLLVKTIADVMDLQFKRIQFTPDLMPGDITGTEILNEKREFQFIKGALFGNIILADEINRTPPKTQSALLEAMQERNVTVNGILYSLPQPFFVLATQNPIEQEGTYPLPEAQLDRFMFNINLDYLSFDEEVNMVRATTNPQVNSLQKIIHGDDIIFYQKLIRKIPVPDNVLEYAVKLAHRTRPNSPQASEKINRFITWGAGPRASQFLVLGAKCHAAMNGKYSPDIEDVKAVAIPVLFHRIVRNYKAEAEGVTAEALVNELL